MKTVIKIALIIFLFTNNTYSQVGIGNTAPKAILDIQASDSSTPTNMDGLLIPRLDAFPVTDPGADQDGMLVFYTPEDIFYFWEDTQKKWIPLYGETTTVITGSGQHYVGELYGGGIIFYVYENGQHGLIASFDDLSTGCDWGPRSDVTTAESWWDGATNTTDAVAAGAVATDAVSLCEDYSIVMDGVTYDDWHLPSIGELKAIEEAAYVLFKVLDSDGDSNTNAPNYSGEYWSSTQISKDYAYSFKFTNTHTESSYKDDNLLVRAVRAF